MKTMLYVLIMLVLVFSLGFCQNSENTQDWTLGASQPSVTNGVRGDGSTGDYLYLPVGTSPFWYEVDPEGNEGAIVFYLHDPGQCTENSDPGVGGTGAMWGLQNPNYTSLNVGIRRRSYNYWCQSYNVWSPIAPYSSWNFNEGVRAANNVPWTPGWYLWSVAGTYTDITFTLYDVDYDTDDVTWQATVGHGNVAETYDAFSFDSAWAAAFGYGWSSLYLRGDDAGAFEDFSLDVCSGTGMFVDAGRTSCTTSGVAKMYQETSWGNMKKMFR